MWSERDVTIDVIFVKLCPAAGASGFINCIVLTSLDANDFGVCNADPD